ncbi:unnamed protein product [Hyaloperonospora brassicae]|uniref:Uncharacterized protein n=1 Tax=Hyaloperonospora brassicae TaxID=162125 RepID=A0AAV0UKK8_HYABA|nr:unnamed protein product [Hyaloperonospora brassicae]
MASATSATRLFDIQRIVGVPATSSSLPALEVSSMAVYTTDKKQLLALAVSEEVPQPSTSRVKSDAASAAAGGAADATRNFLLLRTIEEDERIRFWRFPVCSTAKQLRAGKAERLAALEFSPEGDWLAALSPRKNRLHVIPVLKLVANQRRAMLAASCPDRHRRRVNSHSHHPELLSVCQAAMTTQMASYLRATNEFGGLNGARYHSQVAGDDEQMSTLEFAPGIGTITCVRWWRALNGKNYCLVGGSESLISIVNVEENAEECRCELVQAGTIVSIDLLYEKFRKECRTSMLVKTKTDDEVNDEERDAGGSGVRYYRVVLEKKCQVRANVASTKEKYTRQDEGLTQATSTLKIVTTSGGSSSSSESTFTTTNDVGLSSPFGSAKTPKYVVKTFPQHFLEDLDFRPQRIKKNSPQVCLYPINDTLSSESSLAMYDCKKGRANVYSNFHWRPKGEYEMPSLLPSSCDGTDKRGEAKSSNSNGVQEEEAQDLESSSENDEVVDVDLTYCSTDIMLLQGRTSKSNKTVATWVSLPSHQAADEGIVKAHIVHYLSLHGNEKIERVVQSTVRSRGRLQRGGASVGGSQPGEAEVIYVLQTKHHVYECRPQWSRLALFKALCAQSIALRDALSIGYALGIDMASLCQVVANTLYTSVIDGSVNADAQLIQWVRDLFEESRIVPSGAIEQLTAMGGVQSAIDYARHVLAKPVRESSYDESERRRIAYLLVELVLRQQLQKHKSFDTGAGHVLSGQDKQDEARTTWLVEFLETNLDYVTSDVVDLCLSQSDVEKAILVATRRNEVPQALEKIVQEGLAACVSEQMLRYLLRTGHAATLTCPQSRLILRSFPIEIQAEVLLAHPPSILQHRGWLERNAPSISRTLCRELTAKIDPTQPESSGYIPFATMEKRSSTGPYSDVSTSEYIRTSPEEHVELYLTLLLRLSCNSDRSGEQSMDDDTENDGACSQAKLEMLLKDLATQYRPPIMVARCVDYENWTAAACIYEAHGELVEALECRLQSHNTHNAKLLRSRSVEGTALSTNAITCHALASEDSIGTSVPDVEFHEQMREELFGLLRSLVVRSHSSEAISDQVRAAILARILVKWFDYGLQSAELETFLVDADVFPHVSSLLAQIFFFEVVRSIPRPESVGLAVSTSSEGYGDSFDDRDKEWVLQCQHLSFSGQFLFRVCVSFLEKDQVSQALSGPSPLSPMIQLKLVKTNVVKNDLSHTFVHIAPHSAQALGKTDPLETHMKVFTCGHLFPKRVFEEEVVPEFDKRMSVLPIPLSATKEAFVREFKRGASETPCPVCSFNKISELVFQQYNTRQALQHKERLDGQTGSVATSDSPRQIRSARPHTQKPDMPYYFLHRKASERLGYSTVGGSSTHEAWEWSEQRLP